MRFCPAVLLRRVCLPALAGVIILTVSGGYQSQEMWWLPFKPPLSGDFDHGKTMRPVLFGAASGEFGPHLAAAAAPALQRSGLGARDWGGGVPSM